MSILIRAMSNGDYPSAIALWRSTEGIGLGESDTYEAVDAFLGRNAGLSAVATFQSGELVGAVLCGHDGRRGYLHHLAVRVQQRQQGVADRLIAWCLERLGAEGILKCNVFLFSDNAEGALFWTHNGWARRDELHVFQRRIG